MPYVILTPDDAGREIQVQGSVVTTLLGTRGADRIAVQAQAEATLRLMGGADRVALPAEFGSFQAVRSGAEVTLFDTQGTRLSLAAGATPITLVAAGGEQRSLYIDAGQVMLGDDVIGLSAAPLSGDANGSEKPPVVDDPAPDPVSESEPNDQLSSADAIPLGASVTGVTQASGDQDHFRFTVEQGGAFHLAFDHPAGPGSSGARIDIALLDVAGNQIIEREFRGHGVLDATLDAPGTYYVRISDFPYSSGDGYNGALESAPYRFTTALTTDAATAYDGAETATLATAVATLADGVTPLLPGQVALEGSIAGSGDIDHFRLQAERGGELSLTIGHPSGPGSSGARLDVALLDANGKVITERALRGDGELAASVDSAGTYYVRVVDHPYSSGNGLEGAVSDGRYRLETAFDSQPGVAYDTAANVTLATAVATLADGVTALAPGHAVRGSIAEQGDTDYFALVTTSAGKLRFDIDHPDGPGTQGTRLDISLLDANGEVVQRVESRGDAHFDAAVESEATYYLEVSDHRYSSGNSSDGRGIADGLYQIDIDYLL